MKKITECKASGSDLAGIILLNYLFSILSLGIYFAWGKTRLRKYLWANIKVENEAMEYDGKGSELFLGYLVSLFLLLPILLIIVFFIVISPNEKTFKGLLNLFILLPAAFFIFPFAKYRGLSYLLSRTKLRGIRFSLKGSALHYSMKHALLITASILSLGMLIPYYSLSMWRMRLNNASYGGEHFNLKGSAMDLFIVWIVSLLLAAPTLGLSIFFYFAYEVRYAIANTSLQERRFNLKAGIFDYALLKFTNFLLTIFTLGLAYPWVLARSVRFWSDNLEIDGELQYERISQANEKERRIGDSILGGLQLGV